MSEKEEIRRDAEIEIRVSDLIEKIKKDIKEHEDDFKVTTLEPSEYQMKENLEEMKKRLNKMLSIKKLIEFCNKYNIKYSYNNYPGGNINVTVEVKPGGKDNEAFIVFIYYSEEKLNKIDDVIEIDDVIKLQKKYIKQQEEMIKNLERKIKVKLDDLKELIL